MRLKQPISAEIDVDTKHLIIHGTNNLGRKSKVEIPYEDDHTFMIWLIAVFQEQFRTGTGGGKMIVAEKVVLGMHNTDGQYALSFTFVAGDLQLSFAAPIHTSSPERLSAIQAHLDQALKEMGQTGSVVRQ